MYKVCFLIVLGIGVPKVGENLSVRILWAELNRLLTADVESGTDQGIDVFAILIKEVSLNLSSFSYYYWGKEYCLLYRLLVVV